MYINILWKVIYGTILSWKKLVVSFFFMDSSERVLSLVKKRANR